MIKAWLFFLLISFHSFSVFANDLDGFKPRIWTAESLSIDDLGFSKEEVKIDPNMQKTLEKRTSMLQNHQLWGLVALAGMGLTFFSGGEGSLPPEHPWIAGLTMGTYSVAAYYALMAPDRPPGSSYGQLNWHRWLSWIHLPGMILTPIAGYLAAKQIEKGESLSGLAAQHKNIAGVTVGAFALSTLLVTFEF